VRGYGTIPTSFWPADMPSRIKGNGSAIALACYLMSSPHSNMIGIYNLPIEYVRYDTGLGEQEIRQAFDLFHQAEFAFYDEAATTVYIPSFAATQVGSSLSPKDKRVFAIQGELQKARHAQFRSMFLARYGTAYHLSPIEGGLKRHGGRSSTDEDPESVDNQGAAMGHRRALVPVPDPVSEDKRGPGREDDGKRRPPVSRRGGEPAQVGELVRMYQQEIQRK